MTEGFDEDGFVSEEVQLQEVQNKQDLQALKSHPGFLLLMSALRQDAIEAGIDLKSADPYEPKKIINLQNTIWRFEELQKWLDVLIQIGEQAEQELTNTEQEE